MKNSRVLIGMIAIASSVFFGLVTLVGAQGVASESLPFSCGPHLETYVVSSPDFTFGEGIRCVKWSDGAKTTNHVPVLAWYGEGRWDAIRYRHIGHAFASPLLLQANTYQGFATDMYGNGETVEGDYRGGLVMTIIDRDTIQVSHGWNETWKRVPVTNYQPLPAPTTCGKYFDQYSVQSIDTYSAIQRRKNLPLKVTPGIRCVMRTGAPNTTWFGIGNWHGKQYAHLVTGSSKGYGSSDFCASPEDYCGSASYGSIRRRISPTWKRPIVDGWNEIWIKRLK